jgi:hypothetical protein
MSGRICGTKKSTEDEVRNILAPTPTETWNPISHNDFLSVVDGSLKEKGLHVVNKSFVLSHNDNRLFAVYDLNGSTKKSDFGLSLGLRNSTDKKFPAGFAFGTRVFVCENLMFSGNVVATRKHTCNITSDISTRCNSAIDKFMMSYEGICNKIEFWKETKIEDNDAKAFMWDAANTGVLPMQFLRKKVYPIWERPKHDSHNGGTVWTLHNAISEAMKERQAVNPHWAAYETEMVTDLLSKQWALPLPVIA